MTLFRQFLAPELPESDEIRTWRISYPGCLISWKIEDVFLVKLYFSDDCWARIGQQMMQLSAWIIPFLIPCPAHQISWKVESISAKIILS